MVIEYHVSTNGKLLTILVHPAEEGGYWAEVLELPGCVSQGETMPEVLTNIGAVIDEWKGICTFIETATTWTTTGAAAGSAIRSRMQEQV